MSFMKILFEADDIVAPKLSEVSSMRDQILVVAGNEYSYIRLGGLPLTYANPIVQDTLEDLGGKQLLTKLNEATVIGLFNLYSSFTLLLNICGKKIERTEPRLTYKGCQTYVLGATMLTSTLHFLQDNEIVLSIDACLDLGMLYSSDELVDLLTRPIDILSSNQLPDHLEIAYSTTDADCNFVDDLNAFYIKDVFAEIKRIANQLHLI